MDRRRVLALLGLALSPGCATPGATGPRTPPTPGERSPAAGESGELRITDQGFEAGDDGHLRVLATVQNLTGTERTRTLVAAVTVEGTTTEQRREVTVPADADREVAVDFETVAYDDFTGGGSLQSRLE